MRKFLIIPLLLAFLNVNAFDENTETVVKKKLTIGKSNFLLQFNRESSSYCRGGNLLLNEKEIYTTDINQCIISLNKIDTNNLDMNICYGDGGGSGECVYIKAKYNIKSNIFIFQNKYGYYYTGLEKDLSIKEAEERTTKESNTYFNPTLYNFILDFKYNADFTLLGNIYIRHSEKLTEEYKTKIDNIIEKNKNIFEDDYKKYELINKVQEKLSSLIGKKGGAIDYKIGIYQYLYEKIRNI